MQYWALRFGNSGRSRPQFRRPSQLLSAETADELHQAAHRDPARTLRDPRLGLFHPRDARNVEVQPRLAVDELLEELRRRDRSAPASAGVDDVRDAALDHLFVFLVERQPPELL